MAEHACRTRGNAPCRVARHLALERLEERLLLSGATWTQTSPDGVEYLFEGAQITDAEVQLLMEHFGVAKAEGNYNTVVDGHGTGYRPPSAEDWDRIARDHVLVTGITPLGGDGEDSGILTAPASVDWSASQYFAPIGNQGDEGSCTAWAVGYYTKTFQEALEHGWDLSGASWVGGAPSVAYQDMIFSPDFLYHQINWGSDNGSSFYSAVNIVDTIGAATWSTMPYSQSDHTTWPSEAAWREAPIYRGDAGLQYLDVSSSVESLKTLLASGNLALMPVDAYNMPEMATLDNFFNWSLNHAQTIVGYDDSVAYTEEGEARTGAFKIANSWGDGWSGDGYWWLSYEAMMDRISQVMYYDDMTAYEPEVVAVFNITHSGRGDTYAYFGTGDPPRTTSSWT